MGGKELLSLALTKPHLHRICPVSLLTNLLCLSKPRYEILLGPSLGPYNNTRLTSFAMQASKDVSPRIQEARMRNSKFLAELTKFRLCPYGTFFTLLKVWLLQSLAILHQVKGRKEWERFTVQQPLLQLLATTYASQFSASRLNAVKILFDSPKFLWTVVIIISLLALQSLLDDFAGKNVDATAWLVESAGRFLYLLPETAQRMQNMLEVHLCLHIIKDLTLCMDTASNAIENVSLGHLNLQDSQHSKSSSTNCRSLIAGSHSAGDDKAEE